ncbi:hypothetical protein JCM10213v2_005003 [Rhodosporidiobolus nylandii]
MDGRSETALQSPPTDQQTPPPKKPLGLLDMPTEILEHIRLARLELASTKQLLKFRKKVLADPERAAHVKEIMINPPTWLESEKEVEPGFEPKLRGLLGALSNLTKLACSPWLSVLAVEGDMFSMLPHLVELRFTCEQCDEYDLDLPPDTAAPFPRLSFLHISNHSESSPTAYHLVSRAPNLKELELQCGAGGESRILAALADPASLRILTSIVPSAQDDPDVLAASLSRLISLRILNIQGGKFPFSSKPFRAALQRLALRRLRLDGMKLSATTIEKILNSKDGCLPHLQSLYIWTIQHGPTGGPAKEYVDNPVLFFRRWGEPYWHKKLSFEHFPELIARAEVKGVKLEGADLNAYEAAKRFEAEKRELLRLLRQKDPDIGESYLVELQQKAKAEEEADIAKYCEDMDPEELALMMEFQAELEEMGEWMKEDDEDDGGE